MSLQDTLTERLRSAFDAPPHLEVLDESHNHSRGTESHYKVTLVSERFDGQRLIARHRQVNAALGELMQQFHALALHTYTPEEWRARDADSPDSPRCRGGDQR